MLKFLEIKQDVANGNPYMEYVGSWYGYEYAIIMDVHDDSVIYSFVRDGYQAVFHLPLDVFLNIMWYKDYIKIIQEGIYYNEVPLEEGLL